MKLVNKACLMILLCFFQSIISTKESISRRHRTSYKKRDMKENAKNFALGAVKEFFGFDQECLKSLELTDTPQEESNEKSSLFLSVIEGMQQTRTEIKEFFEEKKAEWGKKNDGYFKKLWFGQDKIDDKIAEYSRFTEESDRKLESINNLKTIVESATFDPETIETLFKEQADSLEKDMVFFINAFGKKGFTKKVNYNSVNDVMNEYNSINLPDNVSNDTPVYDESVWRKVFNSIKKLYSYYRSIRTSALGCIIGSALQVKSVIEAIASTTMAFVPGLNTLTLIWRCAKLVKHVGQALLKFYKAVKATDVVEKWDLFGRSFGRLLRAVTYLLTGVKKHKKRRMIRKIK